MAWKSFRRNQHGIESHFKFRMLGMRDEPALRGIDDALLLARRHGEGGVVQRRARLDSTKAIKLRRRATMSISPCGVR